MSVQEVLVCKGLAGVCDLFGPVRVVEVQQHAACEAAIRDYLQVSLSSAGAKVVPLTSEKTRNRLRFCIFSFGSLFCFYFKRRFDVSTRQALDLGQSCLRIFSSSGHRMQPATQRLLRERISAPLSSNESEEIESRLSAVQVLLDDRMLLRSLQHVLNSSEMFGDAERALQRLALGSVHRSSLYLARDIKSVALALKTYSSLKCDKVSRWELQRKFDWVDEVLACIDTNNPLGVAKGADDLLDKLRDPQSATGELMELEKRLSKELQVSVKISRGRSDEVVFSVANSDASHVAKVSRDHLKIKYVGQRAHTTKWTTDELEEIGRRLANRERDAEKRVEWLLHRLAAKVVAECIHVKQSLMTLFDLDLTVGIATGAISHFLNVPKFHSSAESPQLDLKGVFHPAIEMAHNASVVANNLFLDSRSSKVAIVTGANMSGKSTLLRASALVCWFTQCGLPSAVGRESSVSLFDAVFVRVGSSDDIAHDRSSFMNEMMGVSVLLREQGPVLACLDELGRSTCPEDVSTNKLVNVFAFVS
jgi:DNA mismatch repair protein MutS